MLQLKNMRSHKVHVLSVGISYIGRSPECNIVVPSVVASRQHAKFFVKYIDSVNEHGNHLEVYVSDLKSENGTYLNSKRISGIQEMQLGDVIEIGDENYCLEINDDITKKEDTIKSDALKEFEKKVSEDETRCFPVISD